MMPISTILTFTRRPRCWVCFLLIVPLFSSSLEKNAKFGEDVEWPDHNLYMFYVHYTRHTMVSLQDDLDLWQGPARPQQ